MDLNGTKCTFVSVKGYAMVFDNIQNVDAVNIRILSAI